MTDYLTYEFNDSEDFISTFDELPLWSAPFGLLLLKHLPLTANSVVVDVGSGAGFPLMELAARLGPLSRLYGIDPWVNANRRARQKIRNYGLTNVEIIESSAEQIPFEAGTIDLVVSNLGINNFERPQLVFKECYRVLKPGGRLALTTNLDGHWKEFYKVFEEVARQLEMPGLIHDLKKHQEHRGSVESITRLFTDSGFTVQKCVEDNFEMNFLNGSAFLNHYFVKLGWLSSWRDLVPADKRREVFAALENGLNALAHKNGTLRLAVPMAYVEGVKK
jgi:ubiquinone/menaquinone biosynthesis C-methylase UbiE